MDCIEAFQLSATADFCENGNEYLGSMNVWNFPTTGIIINFSRKTLYHEVSFYFSLFHFHSTAFEVLTTVSTKMAVFSAVVPCSQVHVGQRFRGPCGFHHRTCRYTSTSLVISFERIPLFLLFFYLSFIIPCFHRPPLITHSIYIVCKSHA